MPIHSAHPEGIHYDLGVPRLYREELQEITHILEQECPDFIEIDFHDKRGRTGNRPSDFAEYASHRDAPEVLERLTIEGGRGELRMAVLFERTEGHVMIVNPDNSARGAASQIREICRQNRRFGTKPINVDSPMRGWVQFAIGLAAGCAAVALVSLIGYFIGFYTGYHGVNGLLGYGVFAVMGSVVFIGVSGYIAPDHLRFFMRVLLVNAPRSDRPTWWGRHRRDVANLAVGGLIGYFVNQLPALLNLFGAGGGN